MTQRHAVRHLGRWCSATHDHVEVFDAGLSPNDLLPQRLQAAAERHFLQPAIRRTLYERLIGPVAHLLAGKRRVNIVPHGPLHYVPFQALIAPDGETLLRPGGPELVYGPAPACCFADRLPKPFGFPKTPRVWEGFRPRAWRWATTARPQRLRFAEEEASHRRCCCGGDALVGPASKREALFRQAPTRRYLHISCHGEFDPESPLESLLHLGAGETLTAHQVLDALRLSCELVTLSACESGLSRVRRGDELMGLVRAFMVAGAPAVIATLWRVDERSTRILMERFYREVVAGASFAQALHEAQLYLRTLSPREVVRLLADGHRLAKQTRQAAIGPSPIPSTGRRSSWSALASHYRRAGCCGEESRMAMRFLRNCLKRSRKAARTARQMPIISDNPALHSVRCGIVRLAFSQITAISKTSKGKSSTLTSSNKALPKASVSCSSSNCSAPRAEYRVAGQVGPAAAAGNIDLYLHTRLLRVAA